MQSVFGLVPSARKKSKTIGKTKKTKKNKESWKKHVKNIVKNQKNQKNQSFLRLWQSDL
jgi:hypothetical protein